MGEIKLIKAEEVREITKERIDVKLFVSDLTSHIFKSVKKGKLTNELIEDFKSTEGYSYEFLSLVRNLLIELGYDSRLVITEEDDFLLIIKW